MTRTVGIILLVVAAGLCLVGTALLIALRTESATLGGTTLGFVLLFVVVAPLAGAGAYITLRGRKEEEEEVEAEKLRKLLDFIKSRGEVKVADAIIEMQADFGSIKEMLYQLEGLGVFSGYVNWDDGVIFSAEASELKSISECKNCGGSVSFVGKGVQKCPNCGTEYFVT